MGNSNSVIVLGVSNCGEKMCAAGGRISTQEGCALDIWAKSQDEQKNAALIAKVTRSGHNSTVEHVFYNLAFNDVSVVVEQFMIEFRLASFTVKSRRYVDFSDAGYYTPHFGSDENAKLYHGFVDSLFADYAQLLEMGIPKEDARFVLPYCFYSNFFCSLNGRELLHVLHAMLDGRGRKYPEIFALGKQLFDQVEKLTPGLVADFDQRAPQKSDELDLSFVKGRKKYPHEPPVRLLAYTAEAEKTVALTALLGNRNIAPDAALTAVNDPELRARVIKAVIDSSRPRALESVSFTFELNKVSLACLTHFARHRMHSLIVPSLTQADPKSYIVPESVKSDRGAELIYESCFARSLTLMNELKKQGVPKEALVYLLLAGNTLDIVSTMNARELLLFMKLRCCTRAQWEIQEFANLMLSQLRKQAPELFCRYGPSCFSEGKCPEGRLSCGRTAEVNDKYTVL